MTQRTVTIRGIFEDRITKAVGKVRRDFNALRVDTNALKNTLGPLSTQFAGFVATAVGLAAARSSIQAAERQVQAEAALLVALRGRTDQLERIKQAASDIQAVTTVGDEALLEQAALLANMAVDAERIPDALRAIVDTAAGVNVTLEAAATGIGLFQNNQAGELGERIEIVKRLQAETGLAKEGIEALLAAFPGRAEALAESEFGKVQQEINLLGDESERVGRVLIRVQLGILRVANRISEAIANFTESTLFRSGVDFLERVLGRVADIGTAIASIVGLTAAITVGRFLAPGAKILGLVVAIGTAVRLSRDALTAILGLIPGVDPELTRIAATIGVVAALGAVVAVNTLPKILSIVKAVRVAMVTTLVPFVTVASIVAAVSGGLALVVAHILRVNGLMEPVTDAASDVADFVKEILDDLQSGRLTLADLRDVALRAIAEVGASMGTLIFGPIRNFFANLGTIVSSAFTIVLEQIRSIDRAVIGLVEGGIDRAARLANILPGIDIDVPTRAEQQAEAQFAERIQRSIDRVNTFGDKVIEVSARLAQLEREGGDVVAEEARLERARAKFEEVNLEAAKALRGVRDEATDPAVRNALDSLIERIEAVGEAALVSGADAGELAQQTAAALVSALDALDIEIPITARIDVAADALARALDSSGSATRDILERALTEARRVGEEVDQLLAERRDLNEENRETREQPAPRETVAVDLSSDLDRALASLDTGLRESFLAAVEDGFSSPALFEVLRSVPAELRAGFSDFPTSIAAVVRALPKEVRETGTEVVLNALREEFERERLSLSDLLEAQEAVRTQAIEDEVRARQAALDVAREAVAASNEEGKSIQDRIIALERQRAAEEALFEAQVKQSAVVQEQLRATADAAASAITDQADSIGELEGVAEQRFELVRLGLLDIGEAQRQVADEARGALEDLDQLEGEILQLGDAGKLSKGDVDELLASIDKLRRVASEDIRVVIAEQIAASAERAAMSVNGLADAVVRSKQEGIADDELIARLQLAQDEYERLSETATVALQDVRESVTDPETAAKIDESINKVRERGDAIEETGERATETNVAGSLADGLDRFDEFVDQTASLGAVAFQSLSQLGDLIGDVFIDLFETGGENVRKFTAQFLRSIAQILARAAALQLLSSLLGIQIPGVNLIGRNEGGPVRLNRGGRAKAISKRIIEFAKAGARIERLQSAARPAALAAGLTMAAAPALAGSEPEKLNTGGRPASTPVVIGEPGGWVPGPNVDRDVIHALLTPDEWVIRRMASRYYGDRAMDALNRMLIPREALTALIRGPQRAVIENATHRFQTGGLVGGGSSSSQNSTDPRAVQLVPANIRATVVATEQAYDRQARQNDRGFLDQATRTARALASILREKGGL